MIRNTLAALVIGASALAALGGTTAPAQAGVGIYVNPGIVPPGPGHCWRWSHHRHRWVWACSSPQYYPYYEAPGPVFGFSFGGGPYWGDRRYHDHDRHDRDRYPH